MNYKNSKKYVPHTKANDLYFEIAYFLWSRSSRLQQKDVRLIDSYTAIIDTLSRHFDEYLLPWYMYDLSTWLDALKTHPKQAKKAFQGIPSDYFEVFEKKYTHKQEYFDLTRPDYEVAAFLLEKIEENYHNKFALEQLRNIVIWLRPVFDKKLPTGFSDALISLFSLRRNNPAGWSPHIQKLRLALSNR